MSRATGSESCSIGLNAFRLTDRCCTEVTERQCFPNSRLIATATDFTRLFWFGDFPAWGRETCRNIEPTSSMLSTSFVRPTCWFAMTMRQLSRGREASYRRQTSNFGTSTGSFFDFRGVPGHLHKAVSALSGCLMSEPQCRSLGPSDPEG
jgi:hypothetical protein